MKQNRFRSAMANAKVGLLCVMVWFGPASAAEPVYKCQMYYTGEREFCLRLLNNVHKAEKIEPVIGPTDVHFLDTGEKYEAKIRLYFVKSPMPGPFIYRMRKERNWKAILGYTPWKADSTAGRIVYDSRWRKFDDQCPSLFHIRHHIEPHEIIDTPTRMSLFDFDADGDGKRDKIYRYVKSNDFVQFEVADFEICTLIPIISFRASSGIYRFEGKIYIVAGSAIKADSVYRIQSLAREININDHTCRFSGVNPITQYPRHKHLNHKFKYRR